VYDAHSHHAPLTTCPTAEKDPFTLILEYGYMYTMYVSGIPHAIMYINYIPHAIMYMMASTEYYVPDCNTKIYILGGSSIYHFCFYL